MPAFAPHARLSGSALALGALLLAGCSLKAPPADGATEAVNPGAFVAGAHARVLPKADVGAPSSVPTRTHLDYRGGPVISNVKVVQVLYGPGTYLPEISGPAFGHFFEQAITGPYVDWLSEYDTTLAAKDGTPGTQQHIGRGTWAGLIQIQPSAAAAGPALSDGQIQQELDAQIASGKLPAPDANTLYMVSLPRGVSVSQGGSTSCKSGGFCAYHGSFRHGSQSAYYGVLPDMSAGSGCDVGCGTAAETFDNQTMVASHELMEAITDADVGRDNLAWYDGYNGESGDICLTEKARLLGTDGVLYTVQKIFSNQVGDCIATKVPDSLDFALSVAPASVALTVGGTVQVTVSTSALDAGASSAVALSVLDLPANVTADFAPSATVTAGGSATLSVHGAGLQGPVTVTVMGRDGAGQEFAPLGIQVNAPGTLDPLVNGGFEAGTLTGWTTSGVARVMNWAHTGHKALMLGITNATSGDSTARQSFVAGSGSSSLEFWYQMNCRDLVANDWATASLEDVTAGTSQVLLPHVCSNAGWVQVRTPVVPGHAYTLTLVNHDDGADADPTYTLFDDVVVR